MRIRWLSIVRVVGISLVLIYHFFPENYPGGFIGVDVFFTFSGFLITSLLIDEYCNENKVDFIDFIRRRFYRIFPPMVLMIIVSLPLALLVRSDFLEGIENQVAAVIGFVTNLYEILIGGNYEDRFTPHLFVHMWSLAIEMQFYVIWGLTVWAIGKKKYNSNKFRIQLLYISSALALISYGLMFGMSFFVNNISDIYYSSLTHVFPLFVGAILACLSGIKNTTYVYKSFFSERSGIYNVFILTSATVGLFILGRIYQFEKIYVYQIGFLVASLLTCTMILAARLLHDQTPNIRENKILSFVADTSYGVYLFHWPVFTIFSQITSKISSVTITLVISFIMASVSFYVLEPWFKGSREEYGIKFNVMYKIAAVLGIIILICASVFVMNGAPEIAPLKEKLMIESVKQTKESIRVSKKNVLSGHNADVKEILLIGDSVTLGMASYISENIDGIEVDARVSRNLGGGYDFLKERLAAKALPKNIIIALGTNTHRDYKSLTESILEIIPKGNNIVFVVPYDGRYYGKEEAYVEQYAEYLKKFQKAHPYVALADWRSIAHKNPQIFEGGDKLHIPVYNAEEGGKLFTDTLKNAFKNMKPKP
ncbi:acyltransferase family protein [Eubacteriales bacterium KG127]